MALGHPLWMNNFLKVSKGPTVAGRGMRSENQDSATCVEVFRLLLSKKKTGIFGIWICGGAGPTGGKPAW